MTAVELQAAVARAVRRTEALRAYGVQQAVLAADNLLNTDGISIYLVVKPEQFQEVTAEPGYRYPTWLIGAYGELLVALSHEVGENATFIQNEALAIARLCLTSAGVTENPEMALFSLRMILAESPELDDGYYNVPRSQLMDQLRGASEAELNQLLSDSLSPELEQKLAANTNDGDGWLAELHEVAGPWWDPESSDHWLQVTVVPSSDSAQLTDEQVLAASRCTRFGFNLYELGQDSAEREEIRRHLTNPAETIELDQVEAV